MGLIRIGNEWYSAEVVFVLCECAVYVGEGIIDGLEVAELWRTPSGKYIAVLE